MEQRVIRYHVGIGGWEHEILDECLYGQHRADTLEKLRFYAQFFDTVEVRPTFWDGTITAEDARQWIGAVADRKSFLFNVKLHSSCTHKRDLHPHLTRNIRGMLLELSRHNRLGALIAQFPHAFTNTSSHRFHLVKIAELFSGFPIHAEFRHDSWHHPSTTHFLEENGMQPVSADLPRVRQLMPFTTSVLGETAYLRLHGRNEKGWLLNGMDTRYDYSYNSRELRELLRRISAMTTRCRRVIIIFNNTTGGRAVANAFQLATLLRDGVQVDVPAAALRAFPHLREIARAVDPSAALFGDQIYRAAM